MKRRDRQRDIGPRMEMTPMIDVVFQLLIFFIVTLNPVDVLSRMDVMRPSAPVDKPPEPSLVEIAVHRGGYAIEGRSASLPDIDRSLTRLAGFSPRFSVVIKCTADSPHANLVKLLDVCARLKLENLSVFSL